VTERTSPDPLPELARYGVSVWLDDLSRDLVRSGDLARLVQRGVVGETSNPTIFASALAKGSAYDDQVVALAADGADVERAVVEITTTDVREAADVLAPVHEATDGVDGVVSLEVDPRLAHDTEGTVDSARRLWALVDRRNIMIKIPATDAGLPAITRTLAEGINVNVTLIFGLDRYRAVIDAWLAGLEQARAAGRDLNRLSSVASFFVSRVDTLVDTRLDAIGTPQAAELRGRAAVANARLAYQVYEETLSTPRWTSLASAGARPQRPLWASTGVKDPAYPDTKYVVELVAPDTVNTMPMATLSAVLDHAEIAGDTVRDTYGPAREVLDRIADLGIGYQEMIDQLEGEGVDKFVASWQELLATVRGELDGHAGRRSGTTA
jgi:transaldolase